MAAVNREEELKTGPSDGPERVPRKRLYGKYPNIDVEAFPGGRQVITNNQPGAETVREEGKGGYTEVNDFDGRKTSAHIGPVSMGTGRGYTETVSESSDSQVVKHGRQGYGGGAVTEAGNGIHVASQGGVHRVIDGSHNTAQVSGSSTQIVSSASPQNDSITSVDGDVHEQMRGDRVTYRTGNRIESTKGEVFEDVQGGSKTTAVSGNTRITAGGQSHYHSDGDMAIDSNTIIQVTANTHIKLTVGTATIKIQDKKITAKAGNDVALLLDQDQKHVHLRVGSMRLWITEGGVFSTVPIVVAPDSDEESV